MLRRLVGRHYQRSMEEWASPGREAQATSLAGPRAMFTDSALRGRVRVVHWIWFGFSNPLWRTTSADFTGSKACREEWFSCTVLGGLPDADVIGAVALGPRSSSDRAGRDASRRCPFEALVPTDPTRGAQTIPRATSRPPRRKGVETGEARRPRL